MKDQGDDKVRVARPAGQIGIRRQLLMDSRRAQIMESATSLLAHQSFSTVTVQDIATHAGMSVGNVYRYVKNKEGILLLIFDQILTRYETELPPIAAGPRDATSKLWHVIRTYVDIIDTEPTRTLITYRESGELNIKTLEEVKRREQSSNRPLERIIEQGIASGEFNTVSAPVTAYMIATLAHAWALKGWWLRSRMTAHDYAAQQFRMVLGGVATSPTDGQPLPSVVRNGAV